MIPTSNDQADGTSAHDWGLPTVVASSSDEGRKFASIKSVCVDASRG